MSKRPFVIFGLLVLVLAVLVPIWAFGADGDSENRSGELPADLEHGKTLFQTNCGTCHSLYAAGTDGNFGPDLDLLLAPSGAPTGPTAKQTIKATRTRVLSAIENGVDSTTTGRMPPGILAGEQAKEVADFVAFVAGRG
jgi:mono/diheme cytochrome c family protein